jgi:hypothetical protein
MYRSKAMTNIISQFISQINNKFHQIFTQESNGSTSEETNHQAASPLEIAYSIAHTLPGRVRLHVPWISQDSFYVERLKALLDAEQWITSERINADAASIIITYNYRMISDSKMRSRLASLIKSAASTAVAATNSVAKSTPPASSTKESVQKTTPSVQVTEETPKATDTPQPSTQPVPEELASLFSPTQSPPQEAILVDSSPVQQDVVSSQSPPQEAILVDSSPVQQDVVSSKLEPHTVPETNPVFDSRVFLFEVAGLHQSKETDKMNWSIRHSGNIFIRVPYNRMNKQLRLINRLGGKVVSIQPAHSVDICYTNS